MSQSNGRKSSNSSAVNTPASTPVTNGNSQCISQSTPPPPNNNAPKYGTLVPNRIFVGGISANTTEGELLQLFSTYGTVKAAKIIQDRAGVSKGYGFITFESEDDAKRPLKDADNIVLRERKLNIAPAIKKQPFNRTFDAASPPTVAPGNPAQYYFPPNPAVSYFQGGVAYYPPPTAPGDPNSQPTTVYQAPPVYPTQTGPPQAPSYPSMMFPQTIYMPQQYPMAMPLEYNYYANNGGGPYMGGPPNGSNSAASAPGGTPTSSSGPQPGGHMPPSSSPPRPPCYNPQLHYNPELFYGMPMYGQGAPPNGPPTHLDCPPNLYPETMDLSAGPYSEVSALLGSDYYTFDCGDAPFAPMLPTPDTDDSAASPTSQEQRQTKTPIVSVLSLEEHQEKDFMAMQGGRRAKAPPAPTHPPILYHHGAVAQPPQHAFSFTHFNGPNVAVAPPSQHRSHFAAYANNNKTVNGFRKNRCPTNNNNNNSHNVNNNVNGQPLMQQQARKHYDSSRSSVRTDSNSSSLNGIDENKNEEKLATQPPPGYGTNPMYGNGTRIFSAGLNRRKSGFAQPPPPILLQPSPQQSDIKRNYNPQQMVRSNYMMQGPPPPSVGMRRNKRMGRRVLPNGGSGLAEIGAGDAPLPNQDVEQLCNKMDAFKL